MVNSDTEQTNKLKELCDFYDKNSGCIKSDLFSDKAEEVVKDFLKPSEIIKIPQKKSYTTKKQGKNKDEEKEVDNSRTQIRRFYNEVLSIKNLIDLKDDETPTDKFKIQIPYIKMLIAKAKYAQKRNPPTVTTNFVKFIKYCLEGVKLEDIDKSLKHFNIFVSFFEAVIAYSVVHIEKQ
ncbi:MAG: type III-A CRISPR-associated protein Csm2 [Deltaproteobacteria bacterium]|nr:type III-A CRISPR-associated protein Csm2 [Deltaproteobacteria bacterium]